MKKMIFIYLLFLTGFAFSLDPKLMEHWQKTMKFGIASQRSGVIKAIEDSKTKEAYNIIQEALVSDISPDVRGSAAYSLINLKIDDEKIWLSALSSESNSDVLRKIVFAVSELKIKSAGPRLYNLLTNKIDNPKETLLCSGIIRAIGEIQYRELGSKMLGILTNIDYQNDIRSSAAIALGDIGDAKDISVLSNILQNTGESKDLRMYCAYAIGKTGNSQAVSILSPYIENENEDLNIRLWSIAGISYVKEKGVSEKLINFAKSENVRIRLEAIKSLGHLKDNSSAVELLRYKAVYDPDFGVQKEAKKALLDMGIDLDKENKDKKITPSATTNQSVQDKKTSPATNNNLK